MRQQIETVREQQWQVMWEHHVHGIFRSRRNSETHKRQRDPILALGKALDWQEVRLLGRLTPDLARGYARKTGRTLQRDLNEIVNTGLLERRHGKVRTRREIILAFLHALAAGT